MNVKNARSEIWFYHQGRFKGYCENFGKLAKIESWKDVKPSGRYFKNEKLLGRDFIFPSRLFNRVATVLGLRKRRKSQNRVKAGHRSVGNLRFYVG